MCQGWVGAKIKQIPEWSVRRISETAFVGMQVGSGMFLFVGLGGCGSAPGWVDWVVRGSGCWVGVWQLCCCYLRRFRKMGQRGGGTSDSHSLRGNYSNFHFSHTSRIMKLKILTHGNFACGGNEKRHKQKQEVKPLALPSPRSAVQNPWKQAER